ncbi:MAG: tRNA pseudouridine(55) synthase TruB [Microthrixaceae bacterium]
MSEPPAPNGLCLVDKPATWTSHDVVARSRGLLGTRKVGHAGTLDPMATGLLVLGVGRSTRLLTFLSGLDKTYEAEIRLGVETDSLDADGEVTVTHAMEPPDDDSLAAAVAGLTGPIEQVPPMVSAIKVDGRRLHQLAREGKEVERAPRPVTVHTFDVRRTADPMVLTATVGCSSGTYVRVLAADLGRALGGGAHLTGLRRTAVGPWSVDEATDLEHLQVLDPATVTRVLPAVSVDGAIAAEVRHGRPLAPDRLGVEGEGPWAVTDGAGALLAVYQRQRADRVKPALVLDPAG